MKIPLLLICMGFLLIGCSSVATPSSTLLPSQPAPTPVSKQNRIATATEIQLPYNPVTESAEYCKPPYAFLPVEDGNDISEDEIAYKLAELWLRRYKTPVAHAHCRIDG